jgi:RND superfamily putative drug exporter
LETLTVDDPAFRQVVEQTVERLTAMPDVVAAAANYYELQAAGDPAAEQLVSANRHAAIIPVTLASSEYDDLADDADEFIAAAQSARGNGIEVYAVGDLSGSEVYGKIAQEDLSKDLTIGLPVAAVVLIFVFGALVAAAVPLLLGIVSIIVAMGLTAIAARIIEISSQVQIMITMIGLAVGIDYALFLVERYREERRRGLPQLDAITIAGGTAGKAVFFSGGTVILALLGMFIIPVTVFHSLATGAILAVLVAVFATQTFVPALLGLLGDRIDWPRRRKYDATMVAAQERYDHETIHRGFWGRITRTVMQHPVAALLVALAILIGVALPVIDLKTGQAGIETLPESDVKTGYLILEREFAAGVIAPVRIVVDGPADDPAVTAGVEQLIAQMRQDPLYGAPLVTRSPNNDLTVISVPLKIDPNSNRAYDVVDQLRDELIPAAFGPIANRIFVGGATAATADFNAALRDYTPYVFAFVLGLSFLLLLMAFHSLVVPLKAILMNLLSVAAAYGALVAVVQKGIGADLLVTRTETISAWIPMFLFCVLFGLSMDDHVFLLSRIREHFDLTRRNDESVAVGVQATGKIITGAALIMVVVFGAFASGRLVEIQQMGLGLAVAVFLDATIVRSILVPAAMRLLGDKNWYLPRWLGWLPDLRIEGAPTLRPTPGSAPSPAGAD